MHHPEGLAKLPLNKSPQNGEGNDSDDQIDLAAYGIQQDKTKKELGSVGKLSVGHLWNYYGRKIKEIFMRDREFTEYLRPYDSFKKKDFQKFFVFDQNDNKEVKGIKKRLSESILQLIENNAFNKFFDKYKHKEYLTDKNNQRIIRKLLEKNQNYTD